MVIARWTTPSITYKPSANAASDIAELVLVISQAGVPIIEKDLSTATIEDGAFVWDFAQGETSNLVVGKMASVKIDYLTNDGKRYTTKKFEANVVDSAVNEEIS